MGVPKMFLLPTLFLFFSLGLLFFYYQREIVRHPAGGGTGTAVSFVVNEGEGAAAIAGNLARQKLISSPYIFRFYLVLNNLTKALQAGVFQIPSRASIEEIAGILQHGKFDLKLTFIEGWRREEMARYLNSKFNPSIGSGLTLSEVERVKIQNSKVSFGEEFLEVSEGMEGYLFPDTYYVPTWFTAQQLIEMMRVNFEKKFRSLQDEAREVGEKPPPLSPEELVILASIVEREAKFAKDRPLIAGILMKRYDNDWPLEVDAAVQYALANSRLPAYAEASAGRQIPNSKSEEFDFWPKQITADDLNLDSTYNTRKYKGLPPAPISNPGSASLTSVFFPQESPYWFYLSDKEGQMHYAKTIEEHNHNIDKYLGD